MFSTTQPTRLTRLKARRETSRNPRVQVKKHTHTIPSLQYSYMYVVLVEQYFLLELHNVMWSRTSQCVQLQWTTLNPLWVY